MLYVWQHYKVTEKFPDPTFQKNVLKPIELLCDRSSEILLKDPILLKSPIIKDPKKLAEGFNRTANENEDEDKKEDSKTNINLTLNSNLNMNANGSK